MRFELPEEEFRIPPPVTLDLGGKDVHVWKVNLHAEFLQSAALWPILSEKERERADKFHFPRDRNRFVICRGLLRILIGNYLDLDPANIDFTYNQYGKPFLANAPGEEALRFNVSHSNELALYAFTSSCEIGVDIEFMAAKEDELQIAERFFSPMEVGALHALRADLQTEAFYLCWTRKEAFVKARGQGLSLPLDHFVVSLKPGEPARLLSIKGDPGELRKWSMKSLYPGPGYAAAVVVEGSTCNLKCWVFPQWMWNTFQASRS